MSSGLLLKGDVRAFIDALIGLNPYTQFFPAMSSPLPKKFEKNY